MTEHDRQVVAKDEALVNHLAEVWTSVVAVGKELGPDEWDRATDCPGWTVRDQFSHLIGVERMLLGDEAPAALAADPPHVQNPVGSANEPWIEARRTLPGFEVLHEFITVVDRRLEALRAMTTEDFDRVGWSPLGQVPYRDFMDLRIFDTWAHEQDVRLAVDRPGGRNGIGEEVALRRCGVAMPFVVGKKAAAPEGSSVLFVLAGLLGRRLPVAVEGGRAKVVDALEAPTTTLSMDQETFVRLGLGRLAPADALAAGRVVVAGDAALGQRVVESMAFMI